MERWEDQGIVLSVKGHGENGAIVTLLTENHGRHAGYVRGIRSTKMRGLAEAGNLVDASWQARVSEDLGSYTLEPLKSFGPLHMADPLRLGAIQSACALCDSALPEREGHAGLFHGLLTLLDMLSEDFWREAYIMWEISLLRELGFSLDLTKCAGGGDDSDLIYVSPKTGRAVSRIVGEPYKEKLLPLPSFLRGGHEEIHEADILAGLGLTGYFLEHWAYAHHTRGVPEERLRFYNRMQLKEKCG